MIRTLIVAASVIAVAVASGVAPVSAAPINCPVAGDAVSGGGSRPSVNDYLASGPQAGSAILGGRLFASGGPVTVEYCGAESGYDVQGLLTLDGVDITVADDDTAASPPGTLISLGSITSGRELAFVALVNGAARLGMTAAGNPDGLAHAKILKVGDGLWLVGFEDILGLGDGDFDDLVFLVSGVSNTGSGVEAAPEPGTLMLLGSGLLTLGVVLGRRRRLLARR